MRGLQAEFGLSERQGRRYVNEALERPDGVVVPERHGRCSRCGWRRRLIAGLRERARADGLSLSAVTAAAVAGYLDQAGERPGGQAR